VSKFDKLLARFKTRPNDFTFAELGRLLKGFGYEEVSTGKTGGSRVRFENKRKHTLFLHKPHPTSTLKKYVIHYILIELKKEGHL
jgi:hypothetical protein